jgi:hypothetical protein
MITYKKKKSHNKTKKTRIFKKKDFLSGDGFMVSVWGPIFWTALHTMSFNYPINPTEDDKKHYKEFIINLQYILPCKYCRINLKNNFKTSPIKNSDMQSRDSFSRYVYNLHECVNRMLHKKSNLTYNDVRERYEHFRARCTEEKPKIFNFVEKGKHSKEKGCTEPLYGKKSKCVINIVPQEDKISTFNMDKKCIRSRKKK